MKISKTAGSIKGLDLLKETGFEACDFSVGGAFNPIKGKFADMSEATDEKIYEIYAPIREHADKIGIEIFQTHGIGTFSVKDCPGGLEDYVARARATYLASKILGAKYCVHHPSFINGRRYELGMQEAIEHMLTSYGACNDALEEMGVVCCIENMHHTDVVHRHRAATNLSRASELAQISDALGKNFAVGLDIGHCTVTQDDPVQAIYILGDRIACLHCHDNDGIMDRHQMPYVPQAAPASHHPIKIDWEGVMKALADVGYKGTLSFELTPPGPPPVNVAGYKYLAAIGRYFVSIYENSLKEKKI